MRILSRDPPCNNIGHLTINSTRDKSNALKQILELNNDFPNEKTKSFVQLTLSSENNYELDEWIGWIKSRFARFINDCAEKCHLNIQT
ncbi:unnamed protein product [Rotaria sp. Silwood2]|nr:unnamed protein product [Rotaria sp. Silwood2]CAF4819273.1 unnamed protein product [Rotaria sp. Silwood2]